MASFYSPLSVWIQIASLCFTLSGIHGDILVIRFFLCIAYLCMLTNAVLGSPLWPHVAANAADGMFLDSLLWSVVGLVVNGSSLATLFWDERPIAPHFTSHQAALWRMFYRTGGLSANLFDVIVAPHMETITVAAGDVLATRDYFYILYTGKVDLKVLAADGQVRVQRKHLSGGMFDLQHLGMFEWSVYEAHSLETVAETEATLFRFSRADMVRISHHPLAKGVWQALLIKNLSYVVESTHAPDWYTSYDDPATYCDPLFRPLESWEKPTSWAAGSGTALMRPLEHLLRYMGNSFAPPWNGTATGLRQTLLAPPSRQAPIVDLVRRPSRRRLPRFSTTLGGRSRTAATSSLQNNSAPTAAEALPPAWSFLPDDLVEMGTPVERPAAVVPT
jgi:hypothetical protein